MLDIYLIGIFLMIAGFVYFYLQREHLTAETPLEVRVDKLEDEYKKLHNVVDTQEKRMGAASSQAASAKASLDSIRL
jgi:hypothetical protein